MGQEDHELAPRPDEVAPQALGGLAAFFAQPADEDDEPAALASLDWSLLADGDATSLTADEVLMQAAWSVGQLGGTVVALIAVGPDGAEHRISVPR